MRKVSVLRQAGPEEFEDMTSEELLSHVLGKVGYRMDWTYLPKDALNSLMAYATGEFVYLPRRHEDFSREDLLLMVGAECDIESVIDNADGDYRLRRDELEEVAKFIHETDDKREWT